MIGVYSADEIRAAERAAKATGRSEDNMIECAADALLAVRERMPQKRTIVFAGCGNNGSDALSLALRLHERGEKTSVYVFGDRPNEEVRRRLRRADEVGLAYRNIVSVGDIDLTADDLAVDGLLGIGCNRPVEGLLADVIEAINASGATVLAADIPSGLHADLGKPMGVAVEADVTVTFSAIKQGLLLAEGRNYAGEILVRSVGIPLPPPRMTVSEEADVVLPKRKTVSNKGTYGNVKIIAGSPTMPGASLLAHESALAALRCGTGYAVLCVPTSMQAVYQQRVKEELLCFLPDDGGAVRFDRAALDGVIRKASAIVVGMGMGKNPALPDILRYLSANYDGTLVVDGDGLNALAEDTAVVDGHRCSLVLTPHVVEFARLSKDDGSRPDTERTALVASRLNAVIAMKSATTVISDGKRTVLNVTGTPAMAKAGSGDVLAGMVGAFAATSHDPFLAAVRACYEFGKAGERAAAERGETSVLASDIICCMKHRIKGEIHGNE